MRQQIKLRRTNSILQWSIFQRERIRTYQLRSWGFIYINNSILCHSNNWSLFVKSNTFNHWYKHSWLILWYTSLQPAALNPVRLVMIIDYSTRVITFLHTTTNYLISSRNKNKDEKWSSIGVNNSLVGVLSSFDAINMSAMQIINTIYWWSEQKYSRSRMCAERADPKKQMCTNNGVKQPHQHTPPESSLNDTVYLVPNILMDMV